MKFRAPGRLLSHPSLGYLFLALFCLFYFSYLQSTPTFNDPDSFYHARVAKQMVEHGFRLDFHALPLTTLEQHYADHHFLYHVLLMPFVAWLDPLWGIKIAQVIFATAAMLTLYSFMRAFRYRAPLLWTLAVISTGSFLFRLMLDKVPALSIMLFILGIWAIFRRKKIALAACGFAYVWLYAGFPILIGVVGIAMIIHLFFSWRQPAGGLHNKTIDWKGAADLLLPTLIGILLGIITHPYFPQNLAFYWEQTVRIGLLNQASNIGVGQEWFGQPFLKLVNNIGILAIAGIVIGLFFSSRAVLTARNVVLLVLSVFFFAMTMRSQRNIEYLVPVLAITLAALLTAALQNPRPWHMFFWKNELRARPFFYLLVAAAIVYGGMLIVAKDARWVATNVRHGMSFEHYAGAGRWLEDNAKPGELIWHSDWDLFPELYYHHPSGAYIAGLDPRFFFFANPELFQRWTGITNAITLDNLAERLTTNFPARFFVIQKSKQALLAAARADEQLVEMYADVYVSIFSAELQPTSTAPAVR